MHVTFAALRERNYRIWAAADLVSVTGSWMQTLGINWFVLQATGSATRMGLTLLLQALPVLLLSGPAGALADRLPARPVLVATQSAHALLAVVLAMVAWGHAGGGGGGLGVVYVVSLLAGLLSTIEGPAMGRFNATVVGRAALGNALSLGSLINSTGRIFGMALGGVLVAATGPAPLFAGNAVSFLAVIGALFAIRTGTLHDLERPASADRGVRAGLRYLRTQPVVLGTLALAAVLGSLGRNYQVTMAAMSDGPLHGGAAGYGLLSAVFAAGTVLGGLIAARRTDLGYGLLVGAGLLTSVLQILAGAAPGLWSFAALIIPIAAGAVIIDTTVGARVQLDTRGDMRGRVLAAMAMTSSVAGAAGAPVLGWLAEHAGPRQCLILAGTITVLASVVAGLFLARRHGHQLRPAQVGPALRSALVHRVGAARTPWLRGRTVRLAGRRPGGRRLTGQGPAEAAHQRTSTPSRPPAARPPAPHPATPHPRAPHPGAASNPARTLSGNPAPPPGRR